MAVNRVNKVVIMPVRGKATTPTVYIGRRGMPKPRVYVVTRSSAARLLATLEQRPNWRAGYLTGLNDNLALTWTRLDGPA